MDLMPVRGFPGLNKRLPWEVQGDGEQWVAGFDAWRPGLISPGTRGRLQSQPLEAVICSGWCLGDRVPLNMGLWG